MSKTHPELTEWYTERIEDICSTFQVASEPEFFFFGKFYRFESSGGWTVQGRTAKWYRRRGWWETFTALNYSPRVDNRHLDAD